MKFTKETFKKIVKAIITLATLIGGYIGVDAMNR